MFDCIVNDEIVVKMGLGSPASEDNYVGVKLFGSSLRQSVLAERCSFLVGQLVIFLYKYYAFLIYGFFLFFFFFWKKYINMSFPFY